MARAKVATLLAADTDTLTGHDIAGEATWADKYRDSDRDTTKIRYEATWRWHFMDIELGQSDLASACFGHPPLPPGALAKDCTLATFMFVEQLGTDPRQVAASLIGQISDPRRQEWSRGTPADWAMEAFVMARSDAYGLLPPSDDASEQLLALKFLLHFVGDLHQPLHAADDHDAGRNKKLVMSRCSSNQSTLRAGSPSQRGTPGRG